MTPNTVKPAILVVDDDPRALLALEAILKSDVWEVVTARSSAEALRLLPEREFALLVMDIKMPTMSGIELAAHLQKIGGARLVPILFHTGTYDDRATMLRAYQVGGADFLLKPVEPNILLAKVKVFTEIWSAQENLAALNRKLATEITERERAEDALRQANKALEESNLELRRFAYVASHDLQTPMRSVASFAELLQSSYQDQLDERAHDWIRRIVQSVRLLKTLVNDLLEYSRIDWQSRRLEPVSLQDAFDDAVLLLDQSVRESNAQVTRGELPVVMGERSQLVQLMFNLIGNALKFRGTDVPRVHVSAEGVAGEWTFAVSDNGIGIEAQHQGHVFEIFRRFHDPHQYPGTGIGLAICRRVVERHGGRIWVQSQPGRGSVFYFTIPEATVNKT